MLLFFFKKKKFLDATNTNEEITKIDEHFCRGQFT